MRVSSWTLTCSTYHKIYTYIYVENLRDKYTSTCLQICEEACEVIYKTDNGHSIWIYIFWHFGHTYYHLDTYITIWIHLYCNLNTYKLKFARKYGNSTYIYHFSTFDPVWQAYKWLTNISNQRELHASISFKTTFKCPESFLVYQCLLKHRIKPYLSITAYFHLFVVIPRIP